VPGAAGAARSSSRLPSASKNSMRADPAWSTSENTAPKPFTPSGSVLPGTKKSTVVTFEPIGVNSLWKLKFENALV